MSEKFEPIRQWSESPTNYELCSFFKNIIYELILNFNGSIEDLIIFYSIIIM